MVWQKLAAAFKRLTQAEVTPQAPATAVYQGEDRCRQIALTFDTEFDPVVTPQLLNVLDANQAKCTFFLVGKEVAQYADLTHRIAATHEIGNHTYHHVSLPAFDRATMEKEISDADAAIAAVAGRSPKPYFRPPFGDYNDTVLAAAGAQGYSYVFLWSVAADETATVESEIQDILRLAFPGGIALFHGWTPNTPPALAEALPELRRRGYQFVTISEIMGVDRTSRDWGGTEIYVQEGDTLEHLGECYNTAPSFLAAYNGLSGAPQPGDVLMTPHRDEVMVRLDGARLTFDTYPRLLTDRVVAPVRTVAEAMGATVTWAPVTRQVDVVLGSTTLRFTLDSATALVNGAPMQMPVPAQLYGGRTLVPIRFLAENLGAQVDWDGPSRTVLLRTGR
jgi:peptidoglycan/xylan/chitin deacetylase (PgdA/CDA1 family)